MTGRASPGETVTWLWWSQRPGPAREGWRGPSGCGPRVQTSPGYTECPEQTRSAACGVWSADWWPSHVPAPRYWQHTLSLHSPCTSQSIPFLGVNYKLARGSFSRRGRVTFSVTFIVTTWGSIGSLHSDKWHDPVDLNIVIMTLPLTIVILSSTVYLGHLLDPDTER